MRKIFISLLTVTSLVPSIAYVTACNPFSSPPKSKDLIFNEIKGVEGKIRNIIANKTNDIFYATNGSDIFMKSANGTQFENFAKTGITEEYIDVADMIVNDNNDFFVAAIDDDRTAGAIFKYDNSKKQFSEWFTPKKYEIDAMFLDGNQIYALEKTNDNNPDYALITLDSNAEKDQTATKILDVEARNYYIDQDFIMTANKQAIYMVTSNNNAGITKCDLKTKEVTKYEFKGDNNIQIATYNNELFATVTPKGGTTSELYHSNNGVDYNKVDININFTINNIISDNAGHLYFGGKNKNLYSATIADDFKDFDLASDQVFNNIYKLFYKDNDLLVGSENSIFIGKTK